VHEGRTWLASAPAPPSAQVASPPVRAKHVSSVPARRPSVTTPLGPTATVGEPLPTRVSAPASGAGTGFPVPASTPAPTAPRIAPPPPPHRPLPDDATLPSEVQHLDHTRATLAQGFAAAALAELDAYERAFPTGALSDEAELLRIESLAQAGDVGAAR